VPIARPRVARFARAIPQSASAAFHVLNAKLRLPKSNHGPKLWASQNTFAGHYLFGFSKYGHILGKTLCSSPKRRPGRQAHGQEHSPSSSAPCVVPMRLPRIGQHNKKKPCAKRRALLGVFSSRSSSVSRDIRATYPIWIFLPLFFFMYPFNLFKIHSHEVSFVFRSAGSCRGVYTHSGCDYGPSKVMPYMEPMGQSDRRPSTDH
jgi:hypothetical protein